MPAVELSADEAQNTVKVNWASPPDDTRTGIEMYADNSQNAFKVNWASPPDDVMPAFEVVSDGPTEEVSVKLATPPNDVMPEIEMTANALNGTSSFRLATPPDDVTPAMEVDADNVAQTISMKLGSPPDDVMPAFEVLSDGAASAINVRLSCPPDDGKPEIELASNGITNRISVGLSSPPDDIVPTVELISDANIATVKVAGASAGAYRGTLADPPAIIMSAGLEEARVGIGTSAPAEALDVRGTAEIEGFKMGTGASDGHVLTSDADGNGTWQAPSASSCCQTQAGSENGTGVISITFPSAFPTGVTPTVYATAVLTTAFGSMAKGTCPYAEVSGVTNTGFMVTLKQELGGSMMSSATADVHYIAIGSAE
jgi:hypothetical protein